MIRVLLFDATGTLFHLPRGVGSHYAEVARRHGAELAPEALEAAFRAAWKHAQPAPETRVPRPDDDRSWWRTLAAEVFATCGAPTVIERCFDDLWEHFAQPGVWELFPEVRETLTGLAAHHRLGIVSNFDSRLHRILAALDIAPYFEHVVVSSEAGAEKPSTHIFQLALQRFAVSPQEALHTGDEPEADWRGATTAGLHTFELRRPHNSLTDLAAGLRERSSV